MKFAAPFMIAALALPALSAGADGIQPGLWRITTTVVNNGERSPPHTNARCLTAEQAADLAALRRREHELRAHAL